MKLLLKHKYKTKNYTNGDRVCNLPVPCPDTPSGRSCRYRKKACACTAILAGTYKVTLEYSPRMKRGLPHALQVRKLFNCLNAPLFLLRPT
ncbi:hypothetical protein [Odoribacter laneus]|uniref:hypothetical protein n=1 Tax=Odoribacter laneus TaxID=626933 RepID=UPI000B2E893A|nr:hypothetical protein [Odoribacter laneus]